MNILVMLALMTLIGLLLLQRLAEAKGMIKVPKTSKNQNYNKHSSFNFNEQSGNSLYDIGRKLISRQIKVQIALYFPCFISCTGVKIEHFLYRS